MSDNMEAPDKNNKVKYVKYDIKSEKYGVYKEGIDFGYPTSVAVHVIDNKAIDVLAFSGEHGMRRYYEKDLMHALSSAEKPLARMATLMSMYVDDLQSSVINDKISFTITPISAKEWAKLKSGRIKEDKQMDKKLEVCTERRAKRVKDPLEEKEKRLNHVERRALGHHDMAIRKGKIDKQELKDEVRANAYYHMSYEKLNEIRSNKR